MKVRILACFLLLSGCGDQPVETSNFVTSDSNDTIDNGGSVVDGFDDSNTMVRDVHLTPEEHKEELARIARDEEERARDERWRQSVLPTPRDAFPKIGTCYPSRIKEMEIEHQRAVPHGTMKWAWESNPIRDHGSISIAYKGNILYSNGLEQWFDDTWREPEPPPFANSRIGDWVLMCVVALPDHCPAGVFRGITYRTRNLRTGRVWEEADAPRDCADL